MRLTWQFLGIRFPSNLLNLHLLDICITVHSIILARFQVACKTILMRELLHIVCSEGWQFLRSLDIADVLTVSFGEDQVDFLQTPVGGFWIEEPANQASQLNVMVSSIFDKLT